MEVSRRRQQLDLDSGWRRQPAAVAAHHPLRRRRELGPPPPRGPTHHQIPAVRLPEAEEMRRRWRRQDLLQAATVQLSEQGAQGVEARPSAGRLGLRGVHRENFQIWVSSPGAIGQAREAQNMIRTVMIPPRLEANGWSLLPFRSRWDLIVDAVATY